MEVGDALHDIRADRLIVVRDQLGFFRVEQAIDAVTATKALQMLIASIILQVFLDEGVGADSVALEYSAGKSEFVL